MPVKPIINIKKLNVVYGLGKSNEFYALKNINLEIYPGEFVIFFGPSGCGKSTLLYSIAGLETNIQGDIYVDDKNLSNLSDKEIELIHQMKIGMIFQAYYLISSLSVFKNVILPQIAIGADSAERAGKAMKLLEHFGVKEQANKPPADLSGGQQQRVAICRALINDPDILLADEPVGNLDSKSSEDVLNLLKNYNEKHKKTVVLVTHNPAHLNYAHRVFYMKDGIIIDTKANQPINREFNKNKEEQVTLSKELELLARTYSNISSNQLGNLLIPFKAKQIVSEALIDMTAEEIGQIEKKTEELLIRGISDSGLIAKFFDADINKGGLGMNKNTAIKLADKIKGIIKEIKLLEAEEEKIRLKQITENDEASQLRRYLLDTFNISLADQNSLNAMNSAIRNRIENKIDREIFQKTLDMPIAKGGVGLDKRSARKLAKRLELLILGKYK